MLIYVISFDLQSVMNVNINNQCSNIILTSLVYFIKDTTCYIQFPRQVNSKSIMKVNFITGLGRQTFGGALLYHLQGKEGVLTSTQLLVIWGYRFDWIYSHALLIEHESTFVWNEDKLERLYNAYNSQYEVYTTIFREEWLLDDNTILKTACESSYRGFETEVIISEDEYLSRPIKPLWIDPNR
jgi:hypothetical protein